MKTFIAIMILTTLNILHACPNLAGTYVDDDFQIKIEQNGCQSFELKGGYALQHYQLSNLQVDEEETLCFESNFEKRFCRTLWQENYLDVTIRTLNLSSGKESIEPLKVIRCDYAKDKDCKYGTAKLENTIRVTLKWTVALIPRYKD